MNQKKLTRITVDMPLKKHKQLKLLATLQSKSMREIVLQSIDLYIENATNNTQLVTATADEFIKNIEI